MNKEKITNWLKEAKYVHGFNNYDRGMQVWLGPEDVENLKSAWELMLNIDNILNKLNPVNYPEVEQFIKSYNDCLAIVKELDNPTPAPVVEPAEEEYVEEPFEA